MHTAVESPIKEGDPYASLPTLSDVMDIYHDSYP